MVSRCSAAVARSSWAAKGILSDPDIFPITRKTVIITLAITYYDGANSGTAPTYAIEEFYWTPDGWPIRAVNSPLGDYNHNGVVDAADYTIWRDTLGSTTDLRANGNNIRGSAGVIDEADYVIWRNNFGKSGFGAGSGQATGAPIPEPPAILLFVMAAAAVAQGRFQL